MRSCLKLRRKIGLKLISSRNRPYKHGNREDEEDSIPRLAKIFDRHKATTKRNIKVTFWHEGYVTSRLLTQFWYLFLFYVRMTKLSGLKSLHLGRLEKSKFAGMMRHSNMEWLVRWSGTTKTRLDS